MGKPTIKDIAKKLDIHHSTVSRALRKHPDISPKTQKLVIKAAEEMNYTPNQAALALRGSAAKEVAVAIPELSHFCIRTAVNELADMLRPQDIHVNITVDEIISKADYRRLFSRNAQAGLMFSFVPSTHETIEEIIAQLNQRLVVVELDYAQLLLDTVDALMNLKHRKMAIAVGSIQAEELQTIFKDYLLEHFMPFIGQDFKTGINSVEEGGALAKALLEAYEKPDSLIFTSADAALGFMDTWNEQPRPVPLTVACLEHTPSFKYFREEIICLAKPFSIDRQAIFDFLTKKDDDRQVLWMQAF